MKTFQRKLGLCADWLKKKGGMTDVRVNDSGSAVGPDARLQHHLAY